MTVTSLSSLADDLRRTHATGITRPIAYRRDQLQALVRMLLQQTSRWEAALRADLGKSEAEAHISEIGITVAEARHASKHVAGWAAPRAVGVPIALWPASARTVAQPLGAALVIAPWNYPLQLTLTPLIGAIAAGDAAVVKPSELAPATSALLAELIPQYLDARSVRVVEGAVDETTALLEQRWDLIFYTGNGKVARIVAEAAAKHLTPTVLELGGKSPVYVSATADMDAAARRIVWGKFMNAGQTCVAPDYVLVDRGSEQQLTAALGRAIREQHGAHPLDSPDLGTIVNDRHFERLTGLLSSGRAVHGGETDASSRRIAPTVLVDVVPDSPVMQEEIFGPILPVLPVDGVDGFIEFVNGRDKPLALYVFTRDRDERRRIEAETSSGALGFDVPLAHLQVPGLPFGGVGESGSGAYHGHRSFLAFSHERAVLSKPTRIGPFDVDTLRLVTPPFTRDGLSLVRRLVTRS